MAERGGASLAANPVAPGPPGPEGAASDGPDPSTLHRRLPGYAPTPLLSLPRIAQRLGVREVLAKVETERFGLPAFKMLGASWASFRALCERTGVEPVWSSVEVHRAAFAPLGLTLTTATDGNHGRAVARFARLVGLRAHILVPAGTADARIAAIRSEGASVEVVDGTYDDAVRRAADADPRTSVVVSDTSWEGYEAVPRWVIDGYRTIFAELSEQLAATGRGVPDLMAVPLGVGALGAAAGLYASTAWTADGRPRLLGIEPTSAACVRDAVLAGGIVEVPGPHRSIMAGLNCGLASPVAFPIVRARFHAFVTIEDAAVEDATREFDREGLEVGECAAGTLAGVEAAIALDADGVLGIDGDTTVLLILTEGVTDPASFERIVGHPPTRVAA